ncbi:MAG: hypothetical protein JKY52_08535 [Flavobacteriales bacterium]|nr:hypothetical protein [Flavobacteriales bacterium]
MTVEQDAIEAAMLGIEESINRGEYLDLSPEVNLTLVDAPLFEALDSVKTIQTIIEDEERL